MWRVSRTLVHSVRSHTKTLLPSIRCMRASSNNPSTAAPEDEWQSLKRAPISPQRTAFQRISNSSSMLDLLVIVQDTLQQFKSLSVLEPSATIRILSKLAFGDLGVTENFLLQFDIDGWKSKSKHNKVAGELNNLVNSPAFIEKLLSGDHEAMQKIGLDPHTDLSEQSKLAGSVEEDSKTMNIYLMETNEEKRRAGRLRMVQLFGDTMRQIKFHLESMQFTDISAQECRDLIYSVHGMQQAGLSEYIPFDQVNPRLVQSMAEHANFIGPNVLAQMVRRVLDVGGFEPFTVKPYLKIIAKGLDKVEPMTIVELLEAMKDSKIIFPHFNALVVDHMLRFSGKFNAKTLSMIAELVISSDPELGPRHRSLLDTLSMEILKNPKKFALLDLARIVASMGRLNALSNPVIDVFQQSLQKDLDELFPGTYKMSPSDWFSPSQAQVWNRKEGYLPDEHFYVKASEFLEPFDVIRSVKNDIDQVDPYFGQFITTTEQRNPLTRTVIIPREKLPYSDPSEVPEYSRISRSYNVDAIVCKKYWLEKMRRNKEAVVTSELKWGHQYILLESVMIALEQLVPFCHMTQVNDLFTQMLPYYARNAKTFPSDLMVKTAQIFHKAGTPSNHALFHQLDMFLFNQFTESTQHERILGDTEQSPSKISSIAASALQAASNADEFEDILKRNVLKFQEIQDMSIGSMDFKTLKAKSDLWHPSALTKDEKNSINRLCEILDVSIKIGNPRSSIFMVSCIRKIFRYKNHLTIDLRAKLLAAALRIAPAEIDDIANIAADLALSIDLSELSLQTLVEVIKACPANPPTELDHFVHVQVTSEIANRLRHKEFNRITCSGGLEILETIKHIYPIADTTLLSQLVAKATEQSPTMAPGNVSRLAMVLADAAVYHMEETQFALEASNAIRQLLKYAEQKSLSFSSNELLIFLKAISDCEAKLNRQLIPTWQQEDLVKTIGQRIDGAEAVDALLCTLKSRIFNNRIVEKASKALEAGIQSIQRHQIPDFIISLAEFYVMPHLYEKVLDRAIEYVASAELDSYEMLQLSKMSVAASALASQSPECLKKALEFYEKVVRALGSLPAESIRDDPGFIVTVSQQLFTADVVLRSLDKDEVKNVSRLLVPLRSQFENLLPDMIGEDLVIDDLHERVADVLGSDVEKYYLCPETNALFAAALPSQKIAVHIISPEQTQRGEHKGEISGLLLNQQKALIHFGWKLLLIPHEDWFGMGEDPELKRRYLQDRFGIE